MTTYESLTLASTSNNDADHSEHVAPLLLPELRAKGVVPFVSDLADCFEQVLELLVIET
jgi:hypothetical protein